MRVGHPARQELSAVGRLHQCLNQGKIPLDAQHRDVLSVKRMENVHDFRTLGVAGIM
jgi:hypothetical protein